MDMDELFSQVDEKRKVSMKNSLLLLVEHVTVYNSIHSFCHFPCSLIPTIVGLEFIPACIGQKTGKLP